MRKVPREVLDRLAGIPVFSSCTPKELEQIAGLGAVVDVDEGHVFTKQGARSVECYIALSGKASCVIDGHEVATLGDGEIFGEMGLLDQEPATATVTAVTPMRVLVLNSQEFGGMLRSAPSTMDKVMRTLSARLRAAQSPG